MSSVAPVFPSRRCPGFRISRLYRLGRSLPALALLGLLSGPALAATFTVNVATDTHDANPGDGTCADAASACSLRAAIEEGNALAGDHIINIAPGLIIQIGALGSLQQLRAKYILNGNGSMVNGQGLYGCIDMTDSGTAGIGHATGAAGSTVMNLVVGNCSGNGISANGHGYTFLNNHVGVDVTGTVAMPNTNNGIDLTASAYYPDNTTLMGIYNLLPPSLQPVDFSKINQFSISLTNALVAAGQPTHVIGNVISGNAHHGIEIHGINVAAVFVSGNHIGTDTLGTTAIPNGGSGVRLNASAFGNMIGPGNVISGNGQHGILADSTDVLLPNFIMGNRIGLGDISSVHVGNGLSGIYVDTKPASGIPPNPSGISLLIGPVNVISDNKGTNNDPYPDDVSAEANAGIIITGSSSGVKVQGNTIGLAEFPPGTADSSTAFGNAGDGIIVTVAGNTIGGVSGSTANVIAANLRHGIVVKGSATTSADIKGNFIGVSPSFGGQLTLGNGYDGIHVDGASNINIGGPNPGDGNVIADNKRNGVALRKNGSGIDHGWADLVQRNIIYGNSRSVAGVGIDLEHSMNAPDDPTHSEYPDNYANGDQVQPVICTGPADTGACNGSLAPTSASGTTTLDWTIGTHGPANFRIDIHSVNAASGNAATNESFLGEASVSTDDFGTLTGSGSTTCTGSLPGRCTTTLPADAGGSSLVLTVTDVTSILATPGSGWLAQLKCFLLAPCPVNNTSEFSNAQAVALPAGPVMSTVPNQHVRVGIQFSLDLSTYVNPNGSAITGYAIASGALPGGISLNGSTGVISGPPTAAGSFPAVTINATNANGQTHAPGFTFTVDKGDQVITFGPAPALVVGGATKTVTATSSSGLVPIFSSLTPATCTTNASGTIVTPVAAGACTIAADQAGNANYNVAPQARLMITVTLVAGTPPTWTGLPATQNATVGVPFSLALVTYATPNAAGDPILGYAVASGTLPASLVLDTTLGLISGTPVAAGIQSVTVTVSDMNGPSAPGPIQFTVAKGSQTINFGALADRMLGTPPFTVFATASSGLAVTFSSQTLPVCTVSGSTVTLVSTGTCTIRASQTGNLNWNPATPVDQGFTVIPLSVTHFSVTGAPASTIAGTPFSLTVSALDAANLVVPLYSGTVHFTSNDPAATLPGNTTFVAGDAGVHVFSGIVLAGAGNRTVTATDTVLPSITGTSTTVVVGAAIATHYTVSLPANATAGAPVTATVTALDAYGNVAAGYTGTVHFTSIDLAATLPADYVFTAGDAGVHAFTNGVTLKTAGSQTVTATDTVTATITGTSAIVAVTGGPATLLSVVAPAAVTAGAPITVTVTAKDAYGNVATGYTGTVHFTSTDAAATLPANYVFTAGDAGVHAFTNGVTLKTAGSQTVTATDTVTPAITGTSAAVVVTVGVATHLSVVAPASVTPGTPFTVTVTAQDAYGNTAIGYTGTVHFTSTDATATLPANYIFTAGDAGVHVFTNAVTLNSVGSRTVTATDTVAATITGTSGAITVSGGAATHLSVVAPASVGAGTPFTVTVTAQDTLGNTANGYTGMVHFTSTDAAATLPANYTFTAGDAGVHAFANVMLTAGASRTVTATDTVTASITGTTSVIIVTASGSTTNLVSSVNPSVYGQSVTLTATVVPGVPGTPTGTVNFLDGAVALCSNVALSGALQAACIPASWTTGPHNVTAVYSGDSTYATSTSLNLVQTVNQAQTTTAITSHTPNPSKTTDLIAVSVSVTPTAPGAGTPTGTITVNDGTGASCTITLPSGSCNLQATSSGVKTLTATYGGDLDFVGSVSAGVSHTVTGVTVFSGPTATGTGTATATLTGAGCTFTSAAFIPVAPLTAPPGVDFPHGLFAFQVTGCGSGATATMQIVYPLALTAGAQYWKYGVTPGPTAPHWYALPAGAPNNAVISGSTVTFTITDGGQGDDDVTVNDTIVDAGGVGVPGVIAAEPANIPTLDTWGLIALVGFLMVAGVACLRRQI